MKKLAMSVVGMAFAVVATNASAISEDLGVIPMTGDFEVVTFGNFILNDGGDPSGTPFIDTFTFEIKQTQTITDISVSRLPLTQAGRDILLFNDFRTVLVGMGERVLFDADGQSEDMDLDPGNYTIRISGTSAGLSGGLYSGAIVVSAASAVPIPAAGLLFFSGIAALGLVRSKRARA